MKYEDRFDAFFSVGVGLAFVFSIAGIFYAIEVVVRMFV